MQSRGLGLLIFTFTTQNYSCVSAHARRLGRGLQLGLCFGRELELFGRRSAFIQTQTKSVVMIGILGPALPRTPPPLTTPMQYM